jgi:hypothetical protein
VLSITPAHGLIEAGASKVFKVVFNACDGANIYNFDVSCSVYSQTEVKQYEAAVQQTRVARERIANEFTYTDKGRTGLRRAGAYPIEQHPGGLRGTLVPVGTFTDVDRAAGPRPILAKFLSTWKPHEPHEATLARDASMRVPTETLLLDSQVRAKKYTVRL